MMDDNSSSRLKQIGRAASVIGTAGGTVLKSVVAKLSGQEDQIPTIITEALGKLKGPAMKVGQIFAMVPGMLPDDLANSLMQLQSNAPPMGWPFVRRRMAAELGQGWQDYFQQFEQNASAAASLGQVHKAQLQSGEWVACKLQYPNMINVIQGDLNQLQLLLKLYTAHTPILDTEHIQAELSARLHEELDYTLELKNIQTFQQIYGSYNLDISVPTAYPQLSTGQLLTMEWVDGQGLMQVKDGPLSLRQRIAENLFKAWYVPFYHHGVIHGDPHFGNYKITPEGRIVVLDFGCVRHFSPEFIQGVIKLYHALEYNKLSDAKEAYEAWGFTNMNDELVDALNIWAKFLYGPLMDDRVRPLVNDPTEGKVAAKAVIEALKRSGRVQPPREFVFMDRAAVGIGSAMIHLGVELNWHRLFQAIISDTV